MTRNVLLVFALALTACKRQDDPEIAQATSATAHPSMVASPTPLVAITQPVDSNASAESAPSASVAVLAQPTTTTTTPASTTARPHAPLSMTMGTVTSRGLSPEDVQRVAKQNFGRYRLCYEAGLKANPALAGRVTARIGIDANGAVMSAADAGSDLPDKAVVMCVIGAYGNLSFPEPEDGSATATVPIVFSPPS